MLLSQSQATRVVDQLRGYHLLLKQLAKLSPDARLLASDSDALLTELEHITPDGDIDALLEVCNVG